MRFSEFLIASIIVSFTFFVSTNRLHAAEYEECLAAIEAENQESVLDLAKKIKDTKKVPFSKWEAGATCLQAAFNDDFAYNAQIGSWISGDEARELKNKQFKQKRMVSIKNKLSCHIEKLDLIIKLEQANTEIYQEQNEKLITSLTVEACAELNQRNPSEAILNPICRQAFMSNLHPDLEVKGGDDLVNKLYRARLENAVAKALLEDELEQIMNDGAPRKDVKSIDELIDDALKKCEG